MVIKQIGCSGFYLNQFWSIHSKQIRFLNIILLEYADKITKFNLIKTLPFASDYVPKKEMAKHRFKKNTYSKEFHCKKHVIKHEKLE